MGPTRAKRPQMPRQLKKRFEPKAATHLHGAGRVDFHFYTRDCCILLKSCRFAYSEAQPPYQELHRGREQGNFFTHTCDIWIQAESWRPPSEHGQIPGEHTGLSFLGKEEKKKKKIEEQGRKGGREERFRPPPSLASLALPPPAFPQGPSCVTARGAGPKRAGR